MLVYETLPRDFPDVRCRIVEVSERISPETVQNEQEQFELSLYHCFTVNGGHFHHVIQVEGNGNASKISIL